MNWGEEAPVEREIAPAAFSWRRSTMFPFASLLLAAQLLAQPVTLLVLRSGAEVPVEGTVNTSGNQVVFRTPGGVLYSIPAEEVDLEATRRANAEPRLSVETASFRYLSPAPRVIAEKPSIKVSEEEKRKLLEELALSHGTPSPLPPIAPVAHAAPQPEVVTVTTQRDEYWWRGESRQLEENLRRAQENLQLLVDREKMLNDRILGLLSLGYKPDDFSQQVLQLERAREQMDYANLEVTRAERALRQLKDDAQREGILPGWLR
jgi:hypothetical protein